MSDRIPDETQQALFTCRSNYADDLSTAPGAKRCLVPAEKPLWGTCAVPDNLDTRFAKFDGQTLWDHRADPDIASIIHDHSFQVGAASFPRTLHCIIREDGTSFAPACQTLLDKGLKHSSGKAVSCAAGLHPVSETDAVITCRKFCGEEAGPRT